MCATHQLSDTRYQLKKEILIFGGHRQVNTFVVNLGHQNK